MSSQKLCINYSRFSTVLKPHYLPLPLHTLPHAILISFLLTPKERVFFSPDRILDVTTFQHLRGHLPYRSLTAESREGGEEKSILNVPSPMQDFLNHPTVIPQSDSVTYMSGHPSWSPATCSEGGLAPSAQQSRRRGPGPRKCLQPSPLPVKPHFLAFLTTGQIHSRRPVFTAAAPSSGTLGPSPSLSLAVVSTPPLGGCS